MNGTAFVLRTATVVPNPEIGRIRIRRTISDNETIARPAQGSRDAPRVSADDSLGIRPGHFLLPEPPRLLVIGQHLAELLGVVELLRDALDPLVDPVEEELG